MDKLEQAVRAAADAFLAAKREAVAAGYIVTWQSSGDAESLVVSKGPEPEPVPESAAHANPPPSAPTPEAHDAEADEEHTE